MKPTRLIVTSLVFVVLAFIPAAQADVLYVSNFGAGTISKINTGDGSVSTFVSGLNNPEGLAMDGSGNLYVALQTQGVINKVSPSGVVSQFASNLGFYYLSGLAFDSSGNLYVGANHYEGTFVSAILKFNSQGTLASTWSFPVGGSGPLQPTGLAFDRKGNLIVTDYSGNGLYSISPGGNPTKITPMSVNPLGLAFDNLGNLFVANTASGTIAEITPSIAISTFAFGLSNPAGLAFDSAGNLYAGDSFGTALTKIASDGTASTFAEGLNRPLYIVAVPEPASVGYVALGGVLWVLQRRGKVTSVRLRE